MVQKRSLPDLHRLAASGHLGALPAAVPFDSLAGALPHQLAAAAASGAAAPAAQLRQRLNRCPRL